MRGFASADLPAHGSIRPAGAMRAKLRDDFSRAWKGHFMGMGQRSLCINRVATPFALEQGFWTAFAEDDRRAVRAIGRVGATRQLRCRHIVPSLHHRFVR
jgi:hypothetical protein